MKLNSNIKIENDSIVLVPYRKKHVAQYHQWMKSKELQNLTASNPLSLEEEFKMQESWYTDDNKCTFIILDYELFQEKDEIDSMIGDTNLFLTLNLEDVVSSKSAEVEIMIAEPSFRKKKRGWTATLAMLRYGVEALSINQFIAKIGLDNEASISLFKKMHFQQESISKVFNEVTLILNVDENWLDWLYKNTPCYLVCPMS